MEKVCFSIVVMYFFNLFWFSIILERKNWKIIPDIGCSLLTTLELQRRKLHGLTESDIAKGRIKNAYHYRMRYVRRIAVPTFVSH